MANALYYLRYFSANSLGREVNLCHNRPHPTNIPSFSFGTSGEVPVALAVARFLGIWPLNGSSISSFVALRFLQVSA